MSNSPGECCVAYHGVANGQSSDNVKKATGIICKTAFKAGISQVHKSCDDQYHPGQKVGVGVYCLQQLKLLLINILAYLKLMVKDIKLF